MARQSRYAKVSKTMIHNNKVKEVNLGTPFSTTYLSDLLSPSKVEILNLYEDGVEEIYIIGGKDTGKSFIGYVYGSALLEEDETNQIFMFRKYKSGATEKFHSEMVNVRMDIEVKGYSVPQYVSGRSETIREKYNSWKDKTRNQVISYAAFDRTEDISGISGKNMSKIPFVLIDEPVMENEPNKIPTPKEWNKTLGMIKNSMARINRRHSQYTGKSAGLIKYMACMNAWDNHPIVEDAEELFPEMKFIKWVMEDPIKNHTGIVRTKDGKRAYVRMTKFANPVLSALEQIKNETAKLEDFAELNLLPEMVEEHELILPQIEQALENNDSFELANILGLKYDGTEAALTTYNLNTMLQLDTDELIKNESLKLDGFSIGVDVDLNRRLVLTPTYVVKSSDGIELKENTIIGRQIIHKLNGTQEAKLVGPILNDYIKQMLKDTMVKFNIKDIYEEIPQGLYIYVDDDKNQFKDTLLDWFEYFTDIDIAPKHGDWSIKNRQDNIILGTTSGYYIIDENNIDLLDALKKCTNNIKGQREEVTRQQKRMMDFIDSMEYSLAPWRYNLSLFDLKIGEFTPKKESENANKQKDN